MNQNQKNTLYLVKTKGKKGIFKMLFSRIGIIVLLLILQIFVFISLFQWFSDLIPHFYVFSLVFSSVIIIYIVNNTMNAAAKITWLIVIFVTPIFGSLLYVYTKSNLGHRLLARRTQEIIAKTENLLTQDEQVLTDLSHDNQQLSNLVHYLHYNGNYPIYHHTQTTYFSSGEEKFAAMIEELEKAKEFIFLEYFIIQEGEMWGRILEILARKVQEGVEVRLMFDGTCAFTKVPIDYDERIAALGIQCKMFAPITPFVSTHYNYRDHRKILVIDGTTAFTGGINLADEYINKVEYFGHWKDVAIMLKGDAVKSFTLMFLQLWSIGESDLDFSHYLNKSLPLPQTQPGYVLPYGDDPLDEEKIGENVYIDILNQASSYVHIMSPYLIIDGEMENAIMLAAKRGVDVKIILPGIPDKKIPYAVAKTHYKPLLDAGVDIYEYTPGFIHAKVFVSDNQIAVVGTINLDYRSLYHHFECATLLYQTDTIKDIEQDFQNTVSQSQLILYDDLAKRPFKQKITGWLAKVFAPLL